MQSWWVQALGWAGSALLIFSLLQTRILRFRLLNLTASTPLSDGLTLLARIDNATDKDYQLVRDYATAGRSIYVGLKWAPRL